jgi:hypothetical protein
LWRGSEAGSRDLGKLLPYCGLTFPDNNGTMDTDTSIVTTFRGPCGVYNRSYWHLVSPNGFFYHNVRLARGELVSVSAIAADPNLEKAQTPYSMARLSDVKEAVFENVRRAKFPDRPQRLKALMTGRSRSALSKSGFPTSRDLLMNAASSSSRTSTRRTLFGLMPAQNSLRKMQRSIGGGR